MGLFGNSSTQDAQQGAHACKPAAGGAETAASHEGNDLGAELTLTPQARRIAELLSISPDMVNVTVNVGFNAKMAVEQILELRKENADLRQEVRRLKARCGDITAEDDSMSKEQGQKSVLDMTQRELAAALQANEARVRELELENSRSRMQMVFVPERVHADGHGGSPWLG